MAVEARASCGDCNNNNNNKVILIVILIKIITDFMKVFPEIRGAIQKFPKYINNNYYVLPGSYSAPSPSK
jgi:hypothetical protein